MKVISLPKYNIYIDWSFENYDHFLGDYQDSKLFVVTDENVYFLYKDTLEQKLIERDIFWYVLVDGDYSKTSENAFNIIDFLIKNGAKRNDLLISFGGGVVTDIAGFVASVYMRGINLIHIPTTIISQIDSSIGGKTAVNHEQYKNIVGTFYDPTIVICETKYLDTLQNKEVLNGYGELIKTGLIGDIDILHELDLGDVKYTPDLISKAIEVKKKYVIEDYFDKSIRNTLNFGHTIGHAVEAATNFEISHGEAVIFGMIKALEVGIYLGLTNPKVLDDLNAFLQKISYKVTNLNYTEYEKYLLMDKKGKSDGIRFVFLEDVLKPKIKTISWSKLKDALVNTEK
ncbi:MAG: 3-dehydroquinate synthase [Acholeplasmataceae bacterium]|nr:3-dehydroquinate synthase [Acholeplasmataceae bacterium]